MIIIHVWGFCCIEGLLALTWQLSCNEKQREMKRIWVLSSIQDTSLYHMCIHRSMYGILDDPEWANPVEPPWRSKKAHYKLCVSHKQVIGVLSFPLPLEHILRIFSCGGNSSTVLSVTPLSDSGFVNHTHNYVIVILLQCKYS